MAFLLFRKHHLQWHGIGTQTNCIAPTKNANYLSFNFQRPIFLSTLKGQSFFQTSSTHVDIFLPQFQCSNANL
jgi:hypothetical protein